MYICIYLYVRIYVKGAASLPSLFYGWRAKIYICKQKMSVTKNCSTTPHHIYNADIKKTKCIYLSYKTVMFWKICCSIMRGFT